MRVLNESDMRKVEGGGIFAAIASAITGIGALSYLTAQARLVTEHNANKNGRHSTNYGYVFGPMFTCWICGKP